MSAVTVFGAIALVGLGLVVVGAFVYAFAPGVGRPAGFQGQAEAAGTLGRLVEAIVWAFRTALRRFFSILGTPRDHGAGQVLMTVGMGLLLVGVVGLVISLVVESLGADGDGGGSTSTQPATTG